MGRKTPTFIFYNYQIVLKLFSKRVVKVNHNGGVGEGEEKKSDFGE